MTVCLKFGPWYLSSPQFIGKPRDGSKSFLTGSSYYLILWGIYITHPSTALLNIKKRPKIGFPKNGQSPLLASSPSGRNSITATFHGLKAVPLLRGAEGIPISPVFTIRITRRHARPRGNSTCSTSRLSATAREAIVGNCEMNRS